MTSSSTYPVIKGTLVSTENYTWNTADTLGRGASAMVFLGRHKIRGSYVAVKVFHDHVHAGYKSEDLRELELLKELKHSNIIQLLAIEKMVSNMKQVLVVEYCEGGSLHHMLDQPPYCYGLTEDEFLLVLFHVCDGMKYLQEKKVIHRDIKPGNIMRSITEDGFSIYKLTDFGAARNLHEDESFQSLYGTEEYLHPGMYERAVLKLPNSQLFDAKVDLWSLGVTFFHTATGQLPFQPYGGRSNRHTMFEIITQKESGVISGVQSFEHGPIQWKRDLPESSPLSSGLKSIVIPLLSGLMEPDSSKMISYQSLFRMVHNIRQKVVIHVFHYNKSEDLRIYAEPNITFTGLRDQIASLTDIQASDQILLVGGKALDEVIDPNCLLQDYPPHLLVDKIYLFQREMTEAHRIPKPEIPTFPDFMPFSDMDADARIAHGCSARGELIKRNLEKVSQQQERLINGLFYLRVYVESRLMATKVSHESLKQLMAECKVHIATFFDMVKLLRDAWGDKKTSRDFRFLNEVLNDSVIRQVHEKASDRMVEIEQYRDMLVKKLEDIKNYASKFTAGCPEEKCLKKIQHHMSVISGVHSRFRRDKTVKNQMTNHDENIHGFERQKLQEHCVTMKSIFTDHCLPQLERVYKNSIHICESLTKCLSRVAKIEKNIASVLNCQTLLSDKLFKFRVSCTTDLRTYLKDSGFHSDMSSENLAAKRDHMEAPETGASASSAYSSGARSLGSGEMAEDVEATKADGMVSLSQNASMLKEKLESVMDILDENYSILVRLEESPLQSSGSLSQRLHLMSDLSRENT